VLADGADDRVRRSGQPITAGGHDAARDLGLRVRGYLQDEQRQRREERRDSKA
jgi:hypothetical protein